jgi:putative heme-binding domain-containing protein
MRIGIALLLLTALPLLSQEDHGLTPADIERGGQIFLSNCASCHGPDGDGVSGVNLASNKFRHAATERELIGIIQNGIPGTPMPPGNYPDQVAGSIAGYLHSMARSAPAVLGGVKGDAARGKAIVEGKGQCLDCHRIDSKGSFLGPDLSEIGATRRMAEIEGSLLEPAKEIRADNRTVRMTRTDGTGIARARLLNQDTDTVQVIDDSGKLISLRRTDVREFEILKNSPMPGFKDRLSAQELADTVSYLASRKSSAGA